MYAGSGYAGDFAGDPLLWLDDHLIAWVDAARETIRAAWTGDAALPASYTWITYNAGVVITRGASSPADFTAAVAEVVPNLAAVAVAAGVSDGTYDPLGAENIANLTSIKTFYEHKLRGHYRIENNALVLYELYRGVNALPDFSAAPWQTSATLPFSTAALAAGTTYYFALRLRNKHNLVSQNIATWQIVINVSGQLDSPPSAPTFSLSLAASGAVLVTAYYDSLLEDVGVRADNWAVWITSTGLAPNPALAPDYTEAMRLNDGIAALEWTSGAYAHGTTLRVLVRTLRSGAPGVYSTNTTDQQVTADATGPSVPQATAFIGEAAKQQQ